MTAINTILHDSSFLLLIVYRQRIPGGMIAGMPTPFGLGLCFNTGDHISLAFQGKSEHKLKKMLLEWAEDQRTKF